MGTSAIVWILLALTLRTHPTGAAADATWLVVGGEDASDGQFPYMVALYHDGTFTCSATLISNRLVLTAAHCFFEENGQLLSVGDFHGIVGSANRSDQGTRLEFDSLWLYSNYNLTENSNDVAILKTTHRIDFTKELQSLCLMGEGTKVFEDHDVTAVGWGESDPETEILQFVGLKVVSNSICFKNRETLWPSIICAASGNKKGPRRGDSGGPLVALDSEDSPALVGVASYISSKFYMYTRISHYQDFISKADNDSNVCFVSG